METRSLAPTTRGNMYGSGVVGAVDFFEARYGRAAAHEVIARLPRALRAYVQPNQRSMGILGAKLYPYPFVGELVRTMIAVVHPTDDDAFIREIGGAGMEATLDTVHRVLLRWVVSPQTHAARAQEIWRTYHDSGSLRVITATEHEYVVELSEWPNHDVTFCKICVEARRRMLEKTGLKSVDAQRTKCVAWGHDVCVARYRY